MLKSPRVLIIGHGRHGKDEFAILLCEYGSYSFQSSSWAAAEFIFEDLKNLYNYRTVEECFADRHNHRQEWAVLIDKYNTPNKAKLAIKIYENSNIYVGMRRTEEYNGGVQERLFNFIFYVDAADRVNYVDPTFKIPLDRKKMIVINNNGSIADLRWQAYIANEIIKGKSSIFLEKN